MTAMEVARKWDGTAFERDEYATLRTIEHDMDALEFMVLCDRKNGELKIECECKCETVAKHNARITHQKQGR